MAIFADRNVPRQDVAVAGRDEVLAGPATEIGEVDGDDLMVGVRQRQPQVNIPAGAVLVLEIPAAALAPAIADGTERRDQIAGGLVDRHRLPLGIIGLAKASGQFGSAQHALRNETARSSPPS